ncbi:MAG: hypothetical protein JKP90_12045 [Desulfofustis sp. PB-SRB1]|jgi:hypothetical protein|nr:hypothetical protein [Desulfofustis sp. PB-SRB1]
MTETRRRTYTAPFKAKVGLEASRKVQTTNEVAQAYRAHPPPLLRQKENGEWSYRCVMLGIRSTVNGYSV